jgi:hypothetical protein
MKTHTFAAYFLTLGGLLYRQFADRFAERDPALPPTPRVAQTAPVDPVAEQLKTVAAEVSSKGPQKLDSITTLSRATAEGRTLILSLRYESARWVRRCVTSDLQPQYLGEGVRQL